MKRMGKYLAPFFLCVVFAVFAFPNVYGASLYAGHELYRDLKVERSLQAGHVVLLGPVSSLGNFHFGPAYYYLLYPVVALCGFRPWSMPLASLVYALLFVISLYIVVKKWWASPLLATVVAGIAATSMLSVQFAKYASNPNLVPLFTLLFFYALERLVSAPSKKYAVLLGVALGIAVQLHAVPLICLPIILLAVVAAKKIKLSLLQWVLFLFVTLLVNAPYIYYEFTHSFENLKTLVSIGTEHSGVSLYTHVISYVGFWVSSIVSANDFFNFPLLVGKLFFVVFTAALVLLNSVYLYNSRHRQAQVPAVKTSPIVSFLLKSWFIVPTIILLLPIGALMGLRAYYYLILLPLVCIMLGRGLLFLWERGYRSVVYYIIVVYVSLQVWQVVYYNYLVSRLR